MLAATGRRHGLPYVEIDALLWRDGWQPAPVDEYEAEHACLIADPRWITDGLARLESTAARLARASAIVLVDMLLWTHFWLVAERQIAWAKGSAPSSRSIATGCRRCGAWWRRRKASGTRVVRIADAAALDDAAAL